ncbi:hypothetical protein GALMADRAFT_235479 [Galerina marginata CBS 339.88]|uniref:Transcription initiation factor TFIID subunit 8 n=1 Tax=Galerina marginata (strain CBS 339.88) TaxID=685588 RepID=A0A067TM11_GALM3|nr:hypothetical protein GALMADRAFT_235479 [Galerina marginata CBS 339.88]
MDSPYPNYSSHYPNHYPSVTASIPQPIGYFPPYQGQAQVQQPPKQTPAEAASSDPADPAVTPEVASKALQRLVSSELKNAGFERAVQPALERLEHEVATFVQQLFQRAHEYANLSNRAGAIASDVLLACEEFDIAPKELYQTKKGTAKRKHKNQDAGVNLPKFMSLIPPPLRSPSPELLPSDDEDSPATVPTTLRNLPSYFPDLPPKHTYLQTPASPPKKAALPSLEKKLRTAALVQDSLQHLLLATEDSMNQEDGELLGHIVNWEMNVQPRKRWKVGPR